MSTKKLKIRWTHSPREEFVFDFIRRWEYRKETMPALFNPEQVIPPSEMQQLSNGGSFGLWVQAPTYRLSGPSDPVNLFAALLPETWAEWYPNDLTPFYEQYLTKYVN